MFLQDSVWQGTVSIALVSKLGQSSAWLPDIGSMHSLALVLFPPPQVAVHGEKSSQSAQFPVPANYKSKYIENVLHFLNREQLF